MMSPKNVLPSSVVKPIAFGLLVSVFAASVTNPSAWAQQTQGRDLTMGQKYGIILRSDVHTDQAKLRLIRAETLATVKREYDEDLRTGGSRYLESRIVAGGNVEVYRPKIDEVLRKTDSIVSTRLYGINLQDTPLYKVASILTTALPGGWVGKGIGMGIAAGGAFGHISGTGVTNYDPNFYLNEIPKTISAAMQDDELGQAIRAVYKEAGEFNFDNRNVDVHPAVVANTQLRNQYLLLSETERVKRGNQAIAKQIEKLTKVAEERAAAEAKQLLRDQEIRAYDAVTLEGVQNIQSVGYVFQLFGDTANADRANKVGKVFEIVRGLNKPGVEIGPTAMLNGYLAAATIVMGLLSGPGEDANMKMMAQILEAIAELRREMHERFDAVDAKLRDILALNIREFDNLNRSVDQLHSKINLMQDLIASESQKIEARLREMDQSQISLVEEECLNLSGTVEYKPSLDDRKSCVRKFNQFGNLDSLLDTRGNSMSYYSTKSPTLFVANDAHKTLASQLRSAGNDDLEDAFSFHAQHVQAGATEQISQFYMPAPQDWYRHSSNFLKFLALSTENQAVASAESYRHYIRSGQAIQRFYRSALIDRDSKVRVGVIESLLDAYSFAARRIVEKSNVVNTLVVNKTYGLNVPDFNVQDLPSAYPKYSPLYFTGYNDYGSRDLPWCDDKANFRQLDGAGKQVDARWFADLPAKGHKPKLLGGTAALVSPTLKRWEWLNLGVIEFCFSSVTFKDVQFPNNGGIGAPIPFEIAVDVRFRPNPTAKDQSPPKARTYQQIVASGVGRFNSYDHTKRYTQLMWDQTAHLQNKNETNMREALTNKALTEIVNLAPLVYAPGVKRAKLPKYDASLVKERDELEARATDVIKQYRNDLRTELTLRDEGFRSASRDLEKAASTLQAALELGLEPALSDSDAEQIRNATRLNSNLLSTTTLLNRAFDGENLPSELVDPRKKPYASLTLDIEGQQKAVAAAVAEAISRVRAVAASPTYSEGFKHPGHILINHRIMELEAALKRAYPDGK